MRGLVEKYNKIITECLEQLRQSAIVSYKIEPWFEGVPASDILFSIDIETVEKDEYGSSVNVHISLCLELDNTDTPSGFKCELYSTFPKRITIETVEIGLSNQEITNTINKFCDKAIKKAIGK